ncbi:MAG: CHC2 zinc finger domain-containing protein [Clostridiales bacterium]|nr:CHC2 zinc finger domain-containing protein [Clostridiales bacterium]
MDVFQTVKAAVSVREAAEHYGLKANRSHMACCPFHDDRHPSMKLNEDYFYCFGCGATGDVVELTARLFGLTAYEAAQKLMEDFGLGPDKPPDAAALRKPGHPIAKAFREDEVYCQRVICDYLHVLEDWKVRYAPPSPEAEWDDRFVEACQMLDRMEYLADILTFSNLEDRVKAAGMLRKDGKIAALEKRLTRMKEEEENGRKQEPI